MTALAGTNWSIGYIVDGLLSAAFTLYVGNLGLQGLSKVAVVARRGVNEMLRWCYFDTSKTDSFAEKAVAWVPASVSNFFRDDSGYNEQQIIKEPVLDRDGNKITENGAPKTKDVNKYVHKSLHLLASGLVLSLLALIALEMKEALWRPANPILNHVLSYISPFRTVMGQSWVANGIHCLVGAAKARL